MFGRKKAYADLAQQDDEEVVLVEAKPAASSEPTAAKELPAPPPAGLRKLPAPREEQVTLLGQGVTLEGKLRFQGRARIEGVFRGTIEQGDQLEVGPQALVEADISVGSLLIQGSVTGNVSARQAVEIQAGGKMRGNIKTPAFQVHRGALFTGHCEMGET